MQEHKFYRGKIGLISPLDAYFKNQKFRGREVVFHCEKKWRDSWFSGDARFTAKEPEDDDLYFFEVRLNDYTEITEEEYKDVYNSLG